MLSLWVQVLELLSNRRLSIKDIGIAPVSRNLDHMVSQLLQGIVKVMDSFLSLLCLLCLREHHTSGFWNPVQQNPGTTLPTRSTCLLRVLLHLAQEEEFGKQRSPFRCRLSHKSLQYIPLGSHLVSSKLPSYCACGPLAVRLILVGVLKSHCHRGKAFLEGREPC